MSNNPEISFDVPFTRTECDFLIKLLEDNEDFYDGEDSDTIGALCRRLQESCYGYSDE